MLKECVVFYDCPLELIFSVQWLKTRLLLQFKKNYHIQKKKKNPKSPITYKNWLNMDLDLNVRA